VVVKPNIGWDRMPIHAANTNPDVVGAVVQLRLRSRRQARGRRRRLVQRPEPVLPALGIWRKAYALGAEVVLPAEHRYRTTRMKGEVLDEWPIFTTLSTRQGHPNVPVASTTTSRATPRR